MEGTIGEIRLFAGNFAPRNWAFCQGQLLAISSNTALFSIIGCTYGGDCRTSFGLPDLQGRTPIGVGTGAGLTTRQLGQRSGAETTTLNTLNLPNHTHTLNVSVEIPASAEEGNAETPVGNVMAVVEEGTPYHTGGGDDAMASPAVSATAANTGNSQPANNMQPWIGLNYIICLQGIFPSRS